jgi:hypothetical protein
MVMTFKFDGKAEVVFQSKSCVDGQPGDLE